jgi:hypothetical protein
MLVYWCRLEKKKMMDEDGDSMLQVDMSFRRECEV